MCWRNDANSWQKRMETVLNKNSLLDIPHDVTFVVGEDQVKISCHKIFLAIASPVFEAMFSRRHNPQILQESVNDSDIADISWNIKVDIPNLSSTTTSSELINSQTTSETKHKVPKDLEIHVPDVRPTELINIIKYAYTGVLNVDVKDAVGTMLAANKYNIPNLLEHCAEVLQSEMSNENVVTIYQAALLLNNQKLEEKSWEFIELNAAGLLDSEQLLEFSEHNFCKFLTLEHMPSLESEADVFMSMLKWGCHQIEKEKIDPTIDVLKNAIPLIRYPAMSLDDFNNIVVPSRILSESKCIQLYQYFTASSEEERLSISNNLNYFMEDRAGKCGKQFIFCSIDQKSELEISPEDIENDFDRFKVIGNTGGVKLKAVGIVLPLSYAHLTDVMVRIALYEHSVNEWIGFGTKKVSKFLRMCEVEFDNPVSLKSNVEYEICVNIDREGCWVYDPVSFVRYKKDIMNINSSTTTFSTTENERIALMFSPVQYVIWALRIQC